MSGARIGEGLRSRSSVRGPFVAGVVKTESAPIPTSGVHRGRGGPRAERARPAAGQAAVRPHHGSTMTARSRGGSNGGTPPNSGSLRQNPPIGLKDRRVRHRPDEGEAAAAISRLRQETGASIVSADAGVRTRSRYLRTRTGSSVVVSVAGRPPDSSSAYAISPEPPWRTPARRGAHRRRRSKRER